jgi:hypothetical protein
LWLFKVVSFYCCFGILLNVHTYLVLVK